MRPGRCRQQSTRTRPAARLLTVPRPRPGCRTTPRCATRSRCGRVRAGPLRRCCVATRRKLDRLWQPQRRRVAESARACRIAPMAAAGITRIFPDLTEDLLLNLFHKGAQAQWTSRSLDWTTPLSLSERQRLALARLLTPVYFGEQTAMAGASSILPSVMAAGETTAQLYLASFIMDEARHFEALTKFYRALGHDPLSIREMPELLRYYHRLRQGDRVDWVWGILVSDVIAKHVYRRLRPS